MPIDSRHRLLAIVVLEDPDDRDLEAASGTRVLSPSAAGIELLRHSFHLNGPSAHDTLLGRVLPVAGACPVVRLRYDHSAVGMELACREIRSVLSVATKGMPR